MAKLRRELIIQGVDFDLAHRTGELGRGRLPTAGLLEDTDRADGLCHRVTRLIHIFLKEPVNVVDDASSVVSHSELLGPAKETFLVVREDFQPLVELGQECSIVFAFHQEFFV